MVLLRIGNVARSTVVAVPTDLATRRQRARARTVETVQDVALTMMQERGFDGVTVAAIARGAGVSPSTVYRHFGTKEALVLSGDGTDRLVAAITAEASETTGRVSGVRLAAAGIARLLAEADRVGLARRMRLVFSHRGLTTEFEHRLLGRRDEVARVLATHRGASSARLRDDAAAAAVLGMLVAVLDRWQRRGADRSPVKMWRKAVEATL